VIIRITIETLTTIHEMGDGPVHYVHAEDLDSRDEGGFGDLWVPNLSFMEFFAY
jgi:hypothetical protein